MRSRHVLSMRKTHLIQVTRGVKLLPSGKNKKGAGLQAGPRDIHLREGYWA